MPLIKIETIHPHCKWALWEITESFEDLSQELDLQREGERLEAIKNDLKKREKIAGRVLLKKILESWGEKYEGTTCDQYGKPYLKGQTYNISISHSHGVTVAIVDKKCKIGIDIELIKDKIVKIAPRVFSALEIGKNDLDFHRLTSLWSIKEALYKLYGERGLDFRENIRIQPFNFNETGGECRGEVKTKSDTSTFNIKYLRYNDFTIAYILNT